MVCFLYHKVCNSLIIILYMNCIAFLSLYKWLYLLLEVDVCREPLLFILVALISHAKTGLKVCWTFGPRLLVCTTCRIFCSEVCCLICSLLTVYYRTSACMHSYTLLLMSLWFWSFVRNEPWCCYVCSITSCCACLWYDTYRSLWRFCVSHYRS